MRALRISGPGATAVEEVPDPVADDGAAVVQVRAAAVCGTDRKLVRRGELVGRVLGHEVAGLLDGAPVGVHPDTGCGRCAWCERGWTNRCQAKRSIGIDLDGGLAEQVRVPRGHLVPLDGVPVAVAPLLEPLACCVHAAEVADARAGQTAVVVGAGAMGILSLWALQARGLPVTVVQRSEPRRRIAADLGADRVLAPDEADALDPAPDLVVVTAPGAEPLAWALEHVAPGGTVHAFAGTPGGAAVDANLVHYRHLRLVGSTGSGITDYRAAAELQRTGRVDLARLPTRTVALDDLPAELVRDPDPSVLRTFVDLAKE